ncbi:MAG: CapA family protein [Lachnospiraceae bacterium]|nr:CapA family protein [Lachnospiraceae bacterium]
MRYEKRGKMRKRRIGRLLAVVSVTGVLTACGAKVETQVAVDEIITEESTLQMTQTAEGVYNGTEAEVVIENNKIATDIIDETTVPTTEAVTEIQTEISDEPAQVDIVMVGDILLHTRVNESGLMEDGTYNYDHMFAQVKEDITAADLALVNQEVILGGTELKLSGYPNFNGAFEVGDSLVDAGFDVVLHATNHALDKGKKGLLRCLEFWDTTYPEIGVVGIHDTAEDAEEIYVKEIEGIRIAILNYTYGTNGIALPSDMPYAVDMWDKQAVAEDVARAQEISDFVIVCPHWGTEYVFEETASQKKQAQFLADLGVDLVIGTHPHVVEPVKWITGENGNETLVYYSIGNFINATSGNHTGAAARMLGAMAQVTVVMEDGEAVIANYGVEPLVTHLVEGKGQITTYRMADYTEELAAKNQMRLQDDSFSLQYCIDICDKVFGDLYK